METNPQEDVKPSNSMETPKLTFSAPHRGILSQHKDIQVLGTADSMWKMVLATVTSPTCPAVKPQGAWFESGCDDWLRKWSSNSMVATCQSQCAGLLVTITRNINYKMTIVLYSSRLKTSDGDHELIRRVYWAHSLNKLRNTSHQKEYKFNRLCFTFQSWKLHPSFIYSLC